MTPSERNRNLSYKKRSNITSIISKKKTVEVFRSLSPALIEVCKAAFKYGPMSNECVLAAQEMLAVAKNEGEMAHTLSVDKNGTTFWNPLYNKYYNGDKQAVMRIKIPQYISFYAIVNVLFFIIKMIDNAFEVMGHIPMICPGVSEEYTSYTHPHLDYRMHYMIMKGECTPRDVDEQLMFVTRDRIIETIKKLYPIMCHVEKLCFENDSSRLIKLLSTDLCAFSEKLIGDVQIVKFDFLPIDVNLVRYKDTKRERCTVSSDLDRFMTKGEMGKLKAKLGMKYNIVSMDFSEAVETVRAHPKLFEVDGEEVRRYFESMEYICSMKWIGSDIVTAMVCRLISLCKIVDLETASSDDVREGRYLAWILINDMLPLLSRIESGAMGNDRAIIEMDDGFFYPKYFPTMGRARKIDDLIDPCNVIVSAFEKKIAHGTKISTLEDLFVYSLPFGFETPKYGTYASRAKPSIENSDWYESIKDALIMSLNGIHKHYFEYKKNDWFGDGCSTTKIAKVVSVYNALQSSSVTRAIYDFYFEKHKLIRSTIQEYLLTALKDNEYQLAKIALLLQPHHTRHAKVANVECKSVFRIIRSVVLESLEKKAQIAKIIRADILQMASNKGFSIEEQIRKKRSISDAKLDEFLRKQAQKSNVEFWSEALNYSKTSNSEYLVDVRKDQKSCGDRVTIKKIEFLDLILQKIEGSLNKKESRRSASTAEKRSWNETLSAVSVAHKKIITSLPEIRKKIETMYNETCQEKDTRTYINSIVMNEKRTDIVKRTFAHFSSNMGINGQSVGVLDKLERLYFKSNVGKIGAYINKITDSAVSTLKRSSNGKVVTDIKKRGAVEKLSSLMLLKEVILVTKKITSVLVIPKRPSSSELIKQIIAVQKRFCMYINTSSLRVEPYRIAITKTLASFCEYTKIIVTNCCYRITNLTDNDKFGYAKIVNLLDVDEMIKLLGARKNPFHHDFLFCSEIYPTKDVSEALVNNPRARPENLNNFVKEKFSDITKHVECCGSFGRSWTSAHDSIFNSVIVERSKHTQKAEFLPETHYLHSDYQGNVGFAKCTKKPSDLCLKKYVCNICSTCGCFYNDNIDFYDPFSKTNSLCHSCYNLCYKNSMVSYCDFTGKSRLIAIHEINNIRCKILKKQLEIDEFYSDSDTLESMICFNNSSTEKISQRSIHMRKVSESEKILFTRAPLKRVSIYNPETMGFDTEYVSSEVYKTKIKPRLSGDGKWTFIYKNIYRKYNNVEEDVITPFNIDSIKL